MTSIYGLAPYEEHLCASGLVSLKDRRVKICSDLFNEMCKPKHKLSHLIPKPCERSKSLRNAPPIDPPKFRTNRYSVYIHSICSDELSVILILILYINGSSYVNSMRI